MASGSPPASLIEVMRNGVVESCHYGHVVVANAEGDIVAGAGDPDLVTFPRSALKPIQALNIIESGAAESYRLEPRHICLACASHWGEPFHIDGVAEWLEMIGCAEADLACGPDYPINGGARETIIAGGGTRRPIYHNCSGKHAGFLTTSQRMGWERDYNNFDHPAQIHYRADLSLLTGTDADKFDWGIDHCVLPAAALEMKYMAVAMAKMADPTRLPAGKKDAAGIIFDAIAQEPDYLWGTNGPGSEIVRITKGRIIAKIGAEGYMSAAARDKGLGIALKISDGARRAVSPALIGVLQNLGLLSQDELDALAAHRNPEIKDSQNRVVGELRPAPNILA